MKTTLNLFILFSLLLVFISCNNETVKESDKQTEEQVRLGSDEISDALTVIHNRKSVRQYSDEPVTKEQIELLLKAGMAAPTAGNRQPWHLIAIMDKEVLVDLTEYLPYGQMLNEAAAAIIVCGDLSKVNKDGPEYWVQDCSAVTQNILLAVEAIGLGAVWIGVYPSEQRTEDIIMAMDLPEDIIPLSVISIGYPFGKDDPKDKWDPDKVTWIE
jgi:nitroreductase